MVVTRLENQWNPRVYGRREREDKERSLAGVIEQVVRQLDQGNANWRHFVN